MAINASIQEQQIELSHLSEGTSSINQVAIPATSNSVTHVSVLSNCDGWSTSDEEEDDGKQVAEVSPQAPTENKVQVTNSYTDCTNVSSTVHNTNIYEDGVTVNNNYYCCPSSMNYVVKWCLTRRRIIIVALSVLVILLIIFLSVWLVYLRTSKSSKDVETETTSIIPTTEKIPQGTTTITRSISTDSTSISTTISTSTDSSNTNDEWRIITRDEWGAALPNYVVGKLSPLTPTYVILSETETDGCTTTDKCMKIVRDIQALALEDFFKPDLVYSFLVGGNGMVYEGRGWDVHAIGDYDTEYFDHISISVSFIGTFKDVVPTETMLQAVKTLLEFGVQTVKLAEDYKLKCLRQLSCTSKNPGDRLYNVIEIWKGWDNRTIEDFPPIDPDY